jgi:hypothetical protein
MTKSRGIGRGRGAVHTGKTGGARANAGRRKGSRQRASTEQITLLADKCKTMTELALDTVYDCIRTGGGEHGATRLAAATLVLAHGYGRPAQQLTVTARREHRVDVVLLTVEDLRRELIERGVPEQFLPGPLPEDLLLDEPPEDMVVAIKRMQAKEVAADGASGDGGRS